MEVASYDFAWVDNVDQSLRDRPLVDQYHGNIVSRENGNSDWSSKIYSSILDPSSSSNYDFSASIPSVIGSTLGHGWAALVGLGSDR